MAIAVIDPGHGGFREVGGSSTNNAKVHRADAFVSIHQRGVNGKAQGTEAFHHTRPRTGAYKASTSEAPASAILGWLVTAQRHRPEMLAGSPEQLCAEEAIAGFDRMSLGWRMERTAFVISTGERAFLIHHPAGKPKRAF